MRETVNSIPVVQPQPPVPVQDVAAATAGGSVEEAPWAPPTARPPMAPSKLEDRTPAGTPRRKAQEGVEAARQRMVRRRRNGRPIYVVTHVCSQRCAVNKKPTSSSVDGASLNNERTPVTLENRDKKMRLQCFWSMVSHNHCDSCNLLTKRNNHKARAFCIRHPLMDPKLLISYYNHIKNLNYQSQTEKITIEPT